MSEEMYVNGICHCGKIKITAQIDKNTVRACHCTDCQKMSGAPLRAIAIAPADKIIISGNPKEYVKIADSGNKRIQAFCSECGTQLYATDVDKRNYNLRTGFLEQKNELKPLHHVFTNSWMSWIRNIDF